ncbi:neuronal acetylcholine receptor subunit alpha-10-like [Mizuhopecten yessoensis]|uniref:neuronal acetylcholine receptor subunit alpha-10-like n=1 Tax=Mizuhopecten yessoensis TaxID=6573 RepID=UPI000B457C06|nr:neuronal acetylcholine receptor subunit alpha-10-like [Mizuhopecten yessoensis]
MESLKFVWVLLLMGMAVSGVSGGSFLIESNCSLCQTIPVPTASDFALMLADLFDSTVYDSRVFPRLMQNETIYVDVTFQLYKITDLDEVSGVMNLMAKVTVIWRDEYLTQKYIPGHHKPYEMDSLQPDVWVPPVTIFNSVKGLKPIYDKNYHVKTILAAAKNYWRAGVTTATGCSVDASYYPFDSQSCELILTMWDYTAEEVMFDNSATELDTEYYDENEEWDLEGSTVTTYNSSNKPFRRYVLNLKRRPVFFIVNMISPLVLVGLLNSLVFVLPADAGERIGFAVNVFLTFAVFLTILAENLPKTSQPLATLSYYLSSMLAMSSMSTLVTIFTLRIHDKDEESTVPFYVAALVATMTFRICKEKYKNPEKPEPKAPPPKPKPVATGPEDKSRPPSSMAPSAAPSRMGMEGGLDPLDEVKKPLSHPTQAVVVDDESDDEEEDQQPEIRYGVTWKIVAQTFDKFFFVVFSIGSVALSSVFLVPLFSRA